MKLTKLIPMVVLLIGGLSFTTAAQTMDASSEDGKTIVTLASETNSLSTLVQAVKAAGLVETLNSEGPFTVFAPTNDAFAALPDGTLESLLKPENKEKLKTILTYHVVPGKIMAADLQDGQWVKTVQGNKIKISLDGGAMVNSAQVVKTDIQASNGVVHVIDAVIMPSDNDEKMEEDSDY